MGFDVSRFVGKVHEDIICPICLGVLESPYEVESCGHLFCEKCIRRWIETPIFGPATCPIDRYEINHLKVKPAPKYLKDYLVQLTVRCEFASQGCAVLVKLEDAGHHRANCPLNPERPVSCFRGCGVKLPPKQLLHHRCSLDSCQDAIVWNNVIENAKQGVRQRSFERHQQKSGLTSTLKNFVMTVNKWLADPRILSRMHDG